MSLLTSSKDDPAIRRADRHLRDTIPPAHLRPHANGVLNAEGHSKEAWPPNVADMQHTVDFRRSWVPSPELHDAHPLSTSVHGVTVREHDDEERSANAHGRRRSGGGREDERLYDYQYEHVHERASASGRESRRREETSKRRGEGQSYGDGYSGSRSTSRQTQTQTQTQPASRTGRTYGGEQMRVRVLGADTYTSTYGGDGPGGASLGDEGSAFTRTRPRTRPAGAARERDRERELGHERERERGRGDGREREWSRGQERERERSHEREYVRGHRASREREAEHEAEPALALASQRERNRPRDRGRDCQHRPPEGRERPKSWLSLIHPKKLFRRSRSGRGDDHDEADGGMLPEDESWESGHDGTLQVDTWKSEVTPAQWRAYGYWARIVVEKPWSIVLHNATPRSNTRELSPIEVEEVISRLRDTDGVPHPEVWIAGIEHPSLPPRPSLWPPPPRDFDPPTQNLILNPFLQHKLVGMPALHFDLRLRAEDIVILERPPDNTCVHDSVGTRDAPPPQWHRRPASAGPSPLDTLQQQQWELESSGTGSTSHPVPPRHIVDFWAGGPNGAQPATYPGVPILRIVSLAGDMHARFPWPVTVFAHHPTLPVLVRDVLNALVANFEEFMHDEEVDALSAGRKMMLYQAVWRRLRLPVGGKTPPEDDGIRRVDYLGDGVYFRGLAPDPDPSRRGFMLFMGAPP